LPSETGPTGRALITFERVTKQYPDGTVAMDRLDLEVPAGKTTVLAGPSGCIGRVLAAAAAHDVDRRWASGR
jgi:ABC-type transport system involved in cytochrome bd biosynthesis fused ATPase/permease subunit